MGGPGRGLGVDSFATGLEDPAKKRGIWGGRGEEAREEAGRREGPQGCTSCVNYKVYLKYIPPSQTPSPQPSTLPTPPSPWC